MKKLMYLVFLIMVGTSYAAIYMDTNKDGSITYSDTPSKGAKRIQAPSTNSVPPKNPVNSSSDQEQSNVKPAESSTYSKLDIIAPKDKETISNQPSIPVIMSVEPNLQAGDKIQLYLNGKPAGIPSSSVSQRLGLLNRGTHTINAQIISKENQVLKSSKTITIFVHRNSVLTNPARGQ